MKRERLLISLLILLFVLGAAWFIFSGSRSPQQAAELNAPLLIEETVLSATPIATPALTSPSPSANPNEPTPVSGDDLISEILTAPDLSHPVIVQRLFALLPKLDAEGQAEAAAHIANLSEDDEAKRWSQNVIEWNLPAAAADILYDDLANRPPEIGFPVFGTIADRPQHPKNKETLETLSLISDPPPEGTSWAKWLNQKLQEETSQAP